MSFICEDCNSTLIYCCGTKVRPYLRHHQNQLCNSTGGESTRHKFAKYLIKEFLENGNTIHVRFSCDCSYPPVFIKLNEGDICITEYRKENEIYDIAILNDSKLVSVIEVYNKHKQKRAINFFEFRADDIINHLFESHRLIDCKSECINCNRQNLRTEIEPLCYRLRIIEDDSNSTNNDLLIDKMWEIAINGKTRPIVKIWCSEDFKNERNSWNKLISIGRCVKCLRRSTISYFKPYCSKCYFSIEFPEVGRIVDLSEFKTPLRTIFNRIVKRLPCGNSYFYGMCKICNTYNSKNFFYWSLSDVNNYKHVCSMCLYSIVVEDSREEFLDLRRHVIDELMRLKIS